MQEKKYMGETTLGIDLGSNSIGWALVEQPRGTTDKRILHTGVYIFPVGVQEDKYDKNGTEESKNQARQITRSTRRRYFRYRLRRKKLLQLLWDNQMFPLGFERVQDKNNVYIQPLPQEESSFDLYQIRKKALDEKIELHELGRILYLLNQRRGFLSNRKDQADTKETGEVKERISQLAKKIEETQSRTVGEYFADLYGSNHINADAPIERIRNRWVAREMYVDEINAIWEKQQSFYPNILTGSPIKLRYWKKKEWKIANETSLYYRMVVQTIYYQRGLKSKKFSRIACRYEKGKLGANTSHPLFQEFRMWQDIHNIRIINKDTGEILNLTQEQKNNLAEYLRDKGGLTVKDCLKHLGLSQEWKSKDKDFKVNGMGIWAEFKKQLTPETWELLKDEPEILMRIRELIIFASTDVWLQEKLESSSEKYNIVSEDIKREEIDKEKIVQRGLLYLHLPEKFSGLSLKAIGKLLPHLKDGLRYDEAAKKAYGHHSFEEEIDGKNRLLNEDPAKLILDNPLEITSPIVRQSVAESLRVIREIWRTYGKPDKIHIEMARQFKMPKDEREKLLKANRNKEEGREILRKTLQNQGVIPSFSNIQKYELWLELGLYEKIENLDKVPSLSTIDIEKHKLWLECDRRSLYTGKPISLSKLFSEQIEIEHILPYSLSQDNSRANLSLCELEINREKGNKTALEYICWKNNPDWKEEDYNKHIKATFHGEKLKRLQLLEIDDSWANNQLVNTSWATKALARILKRSFQHVLFMNGQMTATFRKNWGLQDILNQLPTIEKDTNSAEQPPKEKNTRESKKNRSDHRHHALDAIVIALSNKNLYDALANRIKPIEEQGKLTYYQFQRAIKECEPPVVGGKMGLKAMVIETLEKMPVIFRHKKRLLTYKKNPYRYLKAGIVKPIQRPAGIRGSIHEESVYGIIQTSKQERKTVIRKPIDGITSKNIKNIIDKKVREQVIEYVRKYFPEYNLENSKGVDLVEKALKNIPNDPLYMYSKKESIKVPIHKVRISALDKPENLKRTKSGYMTPGNNYIIAIYEKKRVEVKIKKGFELQDIREGEIVSLFDAALKAYRKEAVFPLEKRNKKYHVTLPLRCTLWQNELIVYGFSGEVRQDNMHEWVKYLYRIRKFTSGNIHIIPAIFSKLTDENGKDLSFSKVPDALGNFKKVSFSTIGELLKVE